MIKWSFCFVFFLNFVSSFTMSWKHCSYHSFILKLKLYQEKLKRRSHQTTALYQMLPGVTKKIFELVTFYWHSVLVVSCRLSPKEGWPIGTRCGTKSVFSAQAAKFPWLANPSPRRGRVHTVSSVSAACMPKSVLAATRPSQVSHGLSFDLLVNMTMIVAHPRFNSDLMLFIIS